MGEAEELVKRFEMEQKQHGEKLKALQAEQRDVLAKRLEARRRKKKRMKEQPEGSGKGLRKKVKGKVEEAKLIKMLAVLADAADDDIRESLDEYDDDVDGQVGVEMGGLAGADENKKATIHQD